jgi:ribosomal protein S18 acetylase RimI-like enzyme
MKIKVRIMVEEDIHSVAEVHRRAFTRQSGSDEWIACNFRAAPRMQYYVAVDGPDIIGYIHWTQKSGFRPEVVLELEQIAVLPGAQGRGVGRDLIDGSLPLVREQLGTRGATLKHIIVTTRADNYAQGLYRDALGAEVECTIRDLYSADEVIMIARNVENE